MKCKTQAGLALVGGYLLGRTKKLKLALMVGGLAAGRGLSANPSALLKQGTDAVRSNAELTKLVEQARGGLMDAGKAAMIAAASSRIDSVSERLSDRASSLGSAVPDQIPGQGEDTADEHETDDQGAAEPEASEADVEEHDNGARGNGPTSRSKTRRSTRDRNGSSTPKRSTTRRRTSERARAGARRGEDDG